MIPAGRPSRGFRGFKKLAAVFSGFWDAHRVDVSSRCVSVEPRHMAGESSESVIHGIGGSQVLQICNLVESGLF